ncbi:MAG: TlpA family protein disulfide reductase [Prevotella sp.]|nr:TlpA family protein disulfide reductase [Prevotella sp.]
MDFLKQIKGLIIPLILLSAITSCVVDSDSDYKMELLPLGTIAPDFEIYPSGGLEGFLLSSLKGKYVVLEFWASWCPDCQEATPSMVNLYETYHSEEIIFVGFSLDTDQAQWLAYIEENSMDWIQCSEFLPWKESTVASAYQVSWIPTLYLIDKDGRILFATGSIDEMGEKLKEIS